MEIIKIASIGLITAICVLIVRENKSDVAILVGISGGCLILLSVIDYFLNIFSAIRVIVDKSGIPSQLFSIVVKIIGIGYITDFSAGIIEETGLKSLSEKVVLGGKLIIMVVALPIITMLFDTVSGLLK